MITVRAIGRSAAAVQVRQSGRVSCVKGVNTPAPPPYTGEYTVIPKTTPQTLETAGKRMTEDVSVFAIPYYEVSNPSDGTTVYIGTEL